MVKLFVAKLDYSVTEKELSSLFERFGKVSKLFIPTDKETGKPRGFAFVEIFADNADAIISATDGHTLNGRAISVKIAEERNSDNRENRDNRNSSFRKNENTFRPRNENRDTPKTDRPHNNHQPQRDSSENIGFQDIDLNKGVEKPSIKKDTKKAKPKNVDRLSDGNRKLKMNAYKKSNKNNFFMDDDDDDF